MTRQSVVIVSNRLPISVSKRNGELVFTPSSGGLATAMASIGGDGNQFDRQWIGWPGIAADELTPAERTAIIKHLRRHNCYPVFLTRQQVRLFYEGYANDTLWPLFHYFQSLAQYDSAYWRAYKEVHSLYKKAVVTIADPKDLIWIHDYHLMLLPAQVRTALPDSSIGFFLHIPFPSYEIFRMLPERAEILQGLLGADLIGFHIFDYARHFLSSVARILGLPTSHGSIIMGERVVKIDAFPIGIDYSKFVAALDNAATKREIATLEQHYKGKKLILSVDRLDYSKGIIKRLEAFEAFLRRYPSYVKKIVLLIVAVPSRTEVESYKDLREAIEQAIGRINGAYGTVDWTPISYQFKNLPFEQVLALFAHAEVALLTPLRDGMNLVAKEYVAAKQHTSGVLILSEMTGAIDELPEALRINPNDIDSIVVALRQALTMPKKEQLSRLRIMQRRLAQYTVQRWAADFIEQLQACKRLQLRESSKLLSVDTENKLVRAAKAAKSRILLLDYDGTLRGFAARPEQAIPSAALLHLIERLTALPRTTVCIVSGRPRVTLEDWFGHLHVALAAEHGAFIKNEGEWLQQQATMHEQKKLIIPLLQQYAERTPGARVEEKDFAVVWHYRNVATELASARNASLRYELAQLLGNTDIEIHNGAKIIEMKPRNVRKGAVAEDLLALHPADFIMCIGDDYTDEDMFRALPDEAFTLKVGLADTAARFQIASVERVIELLRNFSKAF
ncbi:MAG TPA: bifunctional alpha,alpha-trehalose-phosphate synthase (UDP-forming)/trehalose-phosphatase [Candidatus Saccharimonadales bacterium]